MAPFHRSATELRQSVREKPNSHGEREWRREVKAKSDVRKESQHLAQKLKRL